jgi:hypothetical protein
VAYARMWHLFVTEDNDEVDEHFASVKREVEFHHGKLSTSGTIDIMLKETGGGGLANDPRRLSVSPTCSSAASVVRISELRAGAPTPLTRSIVRWISEPFQTAKLRLTAHCKNGLLRATASGPTLPAATVVTWLRNAGLAPYPSAVAGVKNNGGLVTLAVIACFAGRYGSQGASYDLQRRLLPADQSAIDNILQALRGSARPLHGIEVTGSDESVIVSDDDFRWRQSVLLFPVEWQAGMLPNGRVGFQIPEDWEWRAGRDGRHLIRIPAYFTVLSAGEGADTVYYLRNTVSNQGEDACRLPHDWIVKKGTFGSDSGDDTDDEYNADWAILTPLGWTRAPDGAGGDKLLLAPPGSKLGVYNGKLQVTVPLSKSDRKIRVIS